MKKLLSIILLTLIISLPCGAKTKANFDGQGYVGTLPDLTRSFKPSESSSTKPNIEQVQPFHSANQVKPAPRDNATFVNIILKQDKTSQYVNDLNQIIPMLEKIQDAIEENDSVQLFNAKVYYFNKNAEFLREKYSNKPESEYFSFKKLMELNTHTKSVALLRSEALKYNPYLAYSGAGYIYDPNNINEQLEYLRTEVEKTILLLKDAN